MAEELYNTNSHSNRTFTVAMWVIGFIAGGQFLAMGWVLMRHQPAASALSKAKLEGEQIGGASLAATGSGGATGIEPGKGILPPMPEIFRKEMSQSASVLPTPPLQGVGGGIPPISAQAYSAHLITDPEVERLLNTASELRASGNMQAALRTLQAAEAKQADHPRILSDIAGVYSQLGLEDKAAVYWEKIYRLGEQRAGAYFDMADMVLKGKQLEPTPNKDSMLSIGDIAEIRDKEVTAGERITLRVKIKAKPGSQPVGADLALLVYFYDLVDGKRFLPSTADTSESYISAPYDWRNGESEQIEVSYYQPVFTKEQKRDLGERVYYGYIVELYYQNELQDVVAAPRKLMGLNPSAPPANKGPMNGPDSSLFPQ